MRGTHNADFKSRVGGGFRIRVLAYALVLLVVVGACVVEDGPQDTSSPTTPTTEAPDSKGKIVEFSTWAEDSFEANAYNEVVSLFEAETGIEVDMDLTVNEVPLEELGR